MQFALMQLLLDFKLWGAKMPLRKFCLSFMDKFPAIFWYSGSPIAKIKCHLSGSNLFSCVSLLILFGTR